MSALSFPASGTSSLRASGRREPPDSIALPADPAAPTSSRWAIAVVAAIIGLTFFLTEHSLDISLVEAYTQTAEEMELAAAGGNAIRRIMFVAIAALGLGLLLQSRGNAWRVYWPLAAAMAAYLFVSFASYLWAADRGMCLRRLVMLACCVCATAGIARRFTMRELCLLTVAIVGPLVLLGLAAEVTLGTFRPWSGDYRFSGSVHPNTQAMYLTALGMAALGLARAKTERFRGVYWAIFAATLVLGVLTKSRTGNASTLLAIGSVFLLQTPLRFKLTAGLALGWLSLAGLWLLLLVGVDPLVDFREALLLGRAEESDTLSGRAFIWPLVSYYISFRPWLGYGYEAFWNPAHIDTISDELQWGLREAHNGYLEVLLSTGIVGLACGAAAILAGLGAAVSGSARLKDSSYSLPLGLLVFGICSSTMESGMVAVMLPPLVLACCLWKMALFADQPAENSAECMSEAKCTKHNQIAGAFRPRRTHAPYDVSPA
jgi:exopolysaccharide production protein ExoQ